jgi:hypothetical protein
VLWWLHAAGIVVYLVHLVRLLLLLLLHLMMMMMMMMMMTWRYCMVHRLGLMLLCCQVVRCVLRLFKRWPCVLLPELVERILGVTHCP